MEKTNLKLHPAKCVCGNLLTFWLNCPRGVAHEGECADGIPVAFCVICRLSYSISGFDYAKKEDPPVA